MDEDVHLAQKDAVTGVGVVPAEDARIWINFIEGVLDVGPGFRSECNLRRFTIRVRAADVGLDVYERLAVEVLEDVPHEDSAHFDVPGLLPVGMDVSED